MHGRTILCSLGILMGAAPAPGWSAAIEEAFICQNRQGERRVELRHAEGPDRLPCQVVYWRDASRADSGRPIWEAENDFGFCIEQTRALLQRLQDGGWSCRKLQLERRRPASRRSRRWRHAASRRCRSRSPPPGPAPVVLRNRSTRRSSATVAPGRALVRGELRARRDRARRSRP